MPANLENTAVTTHLEKVSFHSISKDRQCQRMFKLAYNCTHLTRGIAGLVTININILGISEHKWAGMGEFNSDDPLLSDFIFLGSKITADGNFSHDIKRCSLLGRKVMTNLDSILKSRDITLPTKVRLFKAMVFPVVMYGCESWTVKKAEC